MDPRGMLGSKLWRPRELKSTHSEVIREDATVWGRASGRGELAESLGVAKRWRRASAFALSSVSLSKYKRSRGDSDMGPSDRPIDSRGGEREVRGDDMLLQQGARPEQGARPRTEMRCTEMRHRVV